MSSIYNLMQKFMTGVRDSHPLQFGPAQLPKGRFLKDSTT
jgi:hypothetical protein